MGLGTGLVKSVVFVFNFIFVLAGLGLITIGTLFYLQLETYEKALEPQYQIAPTLILMVGIVVFIIAFFGCCGVCRESYCMLVTYAVILLTLFALQLAIGIYAYLQVNEDGDVQPFVRKNMEKVFEERTHSTEAKEFFDVIQKEFKCCGVNGPVDYFNVVMPASCCQVYDNKACTVLSAWTSGCAGRVSEAIAKGIKILSYVALGICAVEVIGAIFAICLASTLKNESRRRYP